MGIDGCEKGRKESYSEARQEQADTEDRGVYETTAYVNFHSSCPRPQDITGDKTWLETHIWHAKRMKMTTKWGYRLVCRLTDPVLVFDVVGTASYGKVFPAISSRFGSRLYYS